MGAAAQAQARVSAATEALSQTARQGAESLAAALRIVSDLTAMEFALLIQVLRERAAIRPGARLAQNAGEMVSGFAEAGKILLDLAAEESAVGVGVIETALGLSPRMQALADILPRSMSAMVDLHKRLLDGVAEQTRDIVAWYADGKPMQPAARMAGMARIAVASFIETQKEFLDVVAEQVTLATEGGAQSKGRGRARSEVLTELAREGVDKFIAAQKEVLELALERMTNGKPTRTKPEPRTSLGEVTRKSVQNFTRAQKSLLDRALNVVTPEAATAGRKQQERGAGKQAGKRGASRTARSRKSGRSVSRSGSRQARSTATAKAETAAAGV